MDFKEVHGEEEIEIYEDAWEADPNLDENPQDKPSISESIKETLQALDLFMNNKFEEALDLMLPWSHCSSYHSLGRSAVCLIQTMLSFDPDDMTKTMEVLKEGVNVCHKLRRKGALLYITRFLRGVDYNLYSSEEVHAELCYAECLLMTALLTFVADNSFMNFVKGGLKIRACYRAYKEASLILENRHWDDEEERRHYESGVRMGLGIFYLVVAHLPTRVIRVLEMIGFCGDKVAGLQNMYDSVGLDGSLRSPLTALFLLCYNTIITYLFGLADGDLVSSECIAKKMLKKYPRGALYLFLHGRVLEVKGEIDDAINLFIDSLTVQDKWKPMKNLGSWEIMWCYSFKFEWKSAEKHLDYLRKENRWSPAIYTYAYALTLYMQDLEEGKTEVNHVIVDLMKKVPGLKQKLAGKSFPLEKFVVAKSKKFIAQNNRLLLPFIEMMYVFNNFPMFKKKPDIMKKILAAVEKDIPELNMSTEPTTELAEDYCLAILLKAMCFKTMGELAKAEEYLREVLKFEEYFGDDIYIATYSMAEIGYMALDRGEFAEALKWLDKSCHSYTDYHLESYLHYRVHAAIRHIQTVTDCSNINSATPISPVVTPDIYPSNGKNSIFSFDLSSPPSYYSEEKNLCSPHMYNGGTSVPS